MFKIPLLVSVLFACNSHAVRTMGRRDGSDPALPTDPNASKYCTWWVDYQTAEPCSQLLSDNAITLAEFRRWNPSIDAACDNLKVGNSYCVEAFNEPGVTSSAPTTKTTSKSPTTTSKPATTTKPSNGIATPKPTQPDIVDNCDKFYYVKSGDQCDDIYQKYGITAAQFFKWNPSSGSNCQSLSADAYACVSVIGQEPPAATSTKGNGVTTPTPTQTGMVSNCNEFHYVQPSEDCSKIATKYGITVAQFTSWNPAAKSDCTGLWAKTYACVGRIGSGTPTTTKGNGVTTPTPTQTGMTKNCKTFHYVRDDDNCAIIAKKYGITVAKFHNWNPAVGSECKSLWSKTYCCVAVL